MPERSRRQTQERATSICETGRARSSSFSCCGLELPLDGCLLQSQFYAFRARRAHVRSRRANVERNAIQRLAPAILCILAIAAGAAGQKKKKEEITQTLQLPKELPAALIGEPRRFTFHTTPLSAKGLLSAQIRDALKALSHETGGGPVLHIRAFVAGTGDLRRVRDLVSETFTDHKQPLPALSLIRAGGLPMEGAQVVLEAMVAGKKEVNPDGVTFIPAAPAVSENPLD